MNELRDKTQLLIDKGLRVPSLAVVLVGSNPASQTYVRNKANACKELGYMHFQYNLSEDCKEEELLDLIESLNRDDGIDGILVQVPLPKQIDELKAIAAIAPEKDVDGFTEGNAGRLMIGKDCFLPCTPKGIMRIIDFYGIETRGRRAVVIGRSNIVGKPVSMLLMSKGRDATVTVCNSYTEDLRKHTLDADIVIVAVGKPGFIDSSYIKDGAAVIDVGINRIEDSSKRSGFRVVGDVDYDSFGNRDVSLTPVPGGVGVMTVAMLMENTYQARMER